MVHSLEPSREDPHATTGDQEHGMIGNTATLQHAKRNDEESTDTDTDDVSTTSGEEGRGKKGDITYLSLNGYFTS
jgi:hypothetical protein